MELVLAYIDPGSGSLVIQALIAGIVAIPIIFRRQISRVVRALRGSDEPAPDGSGAHEDAPPRP
jgi:hypothetical protein